jgi:hypothetical protein
LVALATAAVFIAGAGAVNNSPSGFESGDGNMTLEGGSAQNKTNTDWNCFQGAAGFATLLSGTPAGCKVTSGATQVTADLPNPPGEVEFAGGTKFDDVCPAIIGGNNPPKDEWSNIAEYVESAPNNDLYFYGASIRPIVNGNSSGNVYFSQNSNGCHTVGDVLLAFDFLQGGGSPTLRSLRWISSGSCYVSHDHAPCWGNEQDITNPALFDGQINTSTIAGTDNAINGATLPANAFSEFGINLTQAIGAGNGGTVPCFANQTWVSRSSGSSFTSQPEDVEVVSKATCGTITIVKHTLNGSGVRPSIGINQQFSYTTTPVTGGLTPQSFHLNDGGRNTGATPPIDDKNCTVNGTYADSTTANPCNTITYTNVPAGSYTVTEGTEPPNYGPGSTPLSCTPAGTGTAASVSGETATITLSFSGSVVCTYTNQQQIGAIRINKTSSKTAATPLTGASFYLCTNDTTSTSSCIAATNASGGTVSNPLTTSGTGGTVCVPNLVFGTYYVFESAAPSGYAIDSTANQSTNVNAGGDCSTSTSATHTFTFTDTPLTNLTITATSQATGGTKSAIQCVDSTPTDIGNSPQPTGVTIGDTSTYSNPVTVSATGSGGLTPGTYTCTVYIDP